MIARLLISLSLFLLLSACATQTTVKRDWPEGIPARGYFETVYAADLRNQQEQTLEDYLKWVVRYYDGWELYRRGWKDVTEDLVTQIEEPDRAEEIRNKMNDIGQSIAGEWAKKTNTRRIYTRHVAIWGNALVESMSRGEQVKLIDIVASDINKLLAERLPVNAITADRYYKQDENDVFSE